MTLPSPFVVTHREVALTTPWFTLRRDELLRVTGQQGTYYVAERLDCAFAIPVTPEGEILVIRQYRHPVGQWCWELPAGGRRLDQTLEEAAEAELREEIGGRAQTWAQIGSFFPCSGFIQATCHVFVATGVRCEAPAREPLEVLEVHRRSLDEALAMARTGEMADGQSALALLMSEAYLRAHVARCA
jgi:ADP-ribose pyrophosphatase